MRCIRFGNALHSCVHHQPDTEPNTKMDTVSEKQVKAKRKEKKRKEKKKELDSVPAVWLNFRFQLRSVLVMLATRVGISRFWVWRRIDDAKLGVSAYAESGS